VAGPSQYSAIGVSAGMLDREVTVAGPSQPNAVGVSGGTLDLPPNVDEQMPYFGEGAEEGADDNDGRTRLYELLVQCTEVRNQCFAQVDSLLKMIPDSRANQPP